MICLPIWVPIIFMLGVLLAVLFLFFYQERSKKFLIIAVLWSVLHSGLALAGFYHHTESFPPRFTMVILPAMVLILVGLIRGQKVQQNAGVRTYKTTLIHTVRILVEVVLYQLYLCEAVPKLMTFEGRNFDILVGITAPIIFWLYLRKRIGKKALLVWNCIGLCFVLFIFFNGILSARLPFQQFAFSQPNIAVEYFPYILLPAVIVPVVIYTHISDIMYLLKDITAEDSSRDTSWR